MQGPIQAELILSGQSHFGHQRLRDPFFEGSVQRCHSKPFNRLFHHRTLKAKISEAVSAR
jgi:hypothetical protein